MQFGLTDLHRHVEAFGFILGVQKRTFKDQDPVNIDASGAVLSAFSIASVTARKHPSFGFATGILRV